MSETTRTDAFDMAHGFAFPDEALRFCRQLERDNAK